jgi:hypothetical protein
MHSSKSKAKHSNTTAHAQGQSKNHNEAKKHSKQMQAMSRKHMKRSVTICDHRHDKRAPAANTLHCRLPVETEPLIY